VFEQLTRGEWQPTLADSAADVHHIFPGEHPLGGERHSRDAVARWFQRLSRLFPRHRFEVQRVLSRGWPWSVWVAVQWVAHLHPVVGDPYVNEGTHWIHIYWGKVTYFHAYLDTQRVADACRQMTMNDIEEADARPIID
jgi:ketosteroid isomerase-like protein